MQHLLVFVVLVLPFYFNLNMWGALLMYHNLEEPVALIGHGGFCEGVTPLSKERE
jgi:hypothetical protein